MLLSHGLKAVAGKTIRFIASSKNKRTTNGTTLVVDLPTGTQDGDLMVALLVADSTTSYTPPANWTEAIDSTNRQVCYRTVSGDSGTATFTASASCIFSCIILTFRNAAYDTRSAVSAAAANPTAASITLASNNSIVLGFPSVGTGTPTSISYTRSGWELIDEYTASPLPCSAVFIKTFKSGATGTVQFTSSGGTNNRAQLVGIKPK